MKTLTLSLIILGASLFPQSPILVGKWQVMKQTSCMENELEEDQTEAELKADMYSRSSGGPQIIQFKENNNAEESTRILSRKKSYKSKALMYKFDGESLHFLDKRSRTIVESFRVEKFTSDSLIISNASRACDTKVLVKIK